MYLLEDRTNIQIRNKSNSVRITDAFVRVSVYVRERERVRVCMYVCLCVAIPRLCGSANS